MRFVGLLCFMAACAAAVSPPLVNLERSLTPRELEERAVSHDAGYSIVFRSQWETHTNTFTIQSGCCKDVSDA